MAKKKTEAPPEGTGPIVAHNLYKLGYGHVVIRHAEIADLIEKKTGRKMSRQRVAAILNSVRVTPQTIKLLADAVGVKPEELTKPPER